MIHTEMQELVRKSVRDFAQKEVAPLAAQIDETGEFPDELYQKLAKNNYFGITIPRKYGGTDAGYVVMAMGENSDAIFQAISDALNANA